MLYQSLGITAGNGATPIPLVIVTEIDMNRSEVLTVNQIGKDCPSVVSDNHTYGVVGGGGQHNILRDIVYTYRYLYLFLVSIVQRHDEPENTGKKEEKHENQELLVQVTEQESPDFLIEEGNT